MIIDLSEGRREMQDVNALATLNQNNFNNFILKRKCCNKGTVK